MGCFSSTLNRPGRPLEQQYPQHSLRVAVAMN
nr:MAG TPA_asm: hypothetical protein [Caudoviricetes sp.]